MGAVSILIILGDIVVAILALVLLVLGAVLFVPVSFRGRAEGFLTADEQDEWDGSARWAADVRWGGILCRFWLEGTHQGVEAKRFTILGIGIPLRKGPKQAKPRARKAGTKQKKQRSRVSREEIQAYIREGMRLVRRLLAALRLHLEGEIRFGLPDPATTGLTLGALALTGLPAGLKVEADWLEPGVRGRVKAHGLVYGIEVARALWSAYWRSPLGRRTARRFPSWRGRRQEAEEHGRAG